MKRILTFATILILVVSVVGPPAMAQSSDSGLVGVPDSNIHEDLPEQAQFGLDRSALTGSVMASDHAETLQVTVTTRSRASEHAPITPPGQAQGGPPAEERLALIFGDNSSHDGRTVALPRAALEDELGYVPEAAWGVHESGDRWTREISEEGDLVTFEIPRFSDNVVTFSGTVNISSPGAQDRSKITYNLSDLDGATDPTLNLTGIVGEEWDNETGSDVGLTSSQSISPAGNLNPTGPGGGDPVLEVTANTPTYTYNPVNDEGDGGGDSSIRAFGDYSDAPEKTEVQINPTYSGTIDEIDVDISSVQGSDYGVNVDVYLVQEGVDTNYGEGTKIGTWDPDWSYGTQTIQISNPPTVEAGTTYTLEFVSDSTDNDGTHDYLKLDTDGSASSDWVSWEGTGWDDYGDVTIREVNEVNNLSASDDSGDSASFGNLSDGETATSTIGIDLSSSSISWSGDGGGTVDYTLQMRERTGTEDPGVGLNDQEWGNVSGTLADGETRSFTLNSSVLQEGTNTVNVTMANLSSDAPTPQVAFELTHEASSEISTEYAANGWVESYNTSKTFTSTRESPTLGIPFSSTVYRIDYLERSVDGGSWQSVDSNNYNLDGSDLTVQLDDGDGDGDVDADTEIAVRVAAHKMDVENGQVTVTDPVEPGDPDLDVGVRIDQKRDGFQIGVGGTKNGNLVHYPYQENWDNPAGVAVQEADGGQYLEFPNAPEGGSFRVKTVPLEIAPETGDAGVIIQDPDEPTFKITPGSSPGDDLTIYYHETSSGKTYELYSTSQSRVVGTDTAESPAIFEQDDSEETFLIRLQESTETIIDGGGNWPQPTPETPLSRYLIVAGWAFLVVAMAYGTGRSSMDSRTRWGLLGITTVGGGLLTLELLNPGSVSERLGQAIGSSLEEILPLAGLAAIGIVVFSIWSWWQKRQTEAATPETEVAFNLESDD